MAQEHQAWLRIYTISVYNNSTGYFMVYPYYCLLDY